MAVYVYKDLKQCAEKIAAAFGLSDDDGRRVIGWFNVNKRDAIADIIAGDLSSVPAVLVDMGITPTAAGAGVNTSDKSGSEKTDSRKQKTKQRETTRKAGGVSSPAVDITTGAAVECETVADVPGVLPDSVPALVMDAIQSYCEQNKIDDLSKERQPRWGAACSVVGSSCFKNSKLLHDIQRERKQGGIIYDVGRVSALVDLWSFLCKHFCKAPLIDDFCNFAGISDTWVYGSATHDTLTPARSLLLKKLHHVQAGGLAGLLVDGRQNPTGIIAIMNNTYWQGNTPKTGENGAMGTDSAVLLPDLGQNTPALTLSGGGSGGSGQ